jgi:hypothetical protein
MKIRFGFVTNSSSSSFLVAFDHLPESVGELEKIMFGDEPAHIGWDEQYSTYEIAEVVFNELKEQISTPLSNDEIEYEFACGYTGNEPRMDNFRLEDGHIDWEKYDAAVRKITDKLAKEFIDSLNGSPVYKFTYSDNDGAFYSMMEHSGIFDRLKHQIIGHH